MWTNPSSPPPQMWSPKSPTSSRFSAPQSPRTPVSASVPTYKLKNQGRRFAQIIKLKPECVEDYKKCHAKVWPEVLQQIKSCAIEDCRCCFLLFILFLKSSACFFSLFSVGGLEEDSIFLDPDTNTLFASFKYLGYDYAGDMERMRENPKVQEWWKMTDSYQESLVEGAKSSVDGEPSWWKPLEEVFYTP
ncbi:hypothetical protein CJF30_00008493 [Rutstroemia sp. NJR-2017a BBW]|nr:hypothetical protein CJF30_00008493 [Rutstroemia sp. NJR-2017a BBW]